MRLQKCAYKKCHFIAFSLKKCTCPPKVKMHPLISGWFSAFPALLYFYYYLRPNPKSEVQPNLRFSFISSHNLLKSRVFAINITGLFFPTLKVEQAHFSHLTTCLTTCGDFCFIFGYFSIV